MARSLSPFVSVSITSPGGRVLLEHEPAKERAREVLQIKRTGNIGICFNVAAKAASGAVSLNVTLNVEDAEDAERTRTTKASYSRTSPVSIGAVKGSGAYRQMKYITKALTGIRRTYTALSDDDNGMRYSIVEAESNTWIVTYIFVTIAIITNVVNFVRLRRVMKRYKLI
ncbi:hypothetical protein STCU_05672 [Strigomonas culicis]|nr:hypothetical protein STCU_05672 [Strigomonas culicis]|eukprot:EPY27595.1 hypothetical protein STCU_05672 [Strigomonas culicis]